VVVIWGRSCSRSAWFLGLHGNAVARAAVGSPVAAAAAAGRLILLLTIESDVFLGANALVGLGRSGIVKVLSVCGVVRRSQ
jgi:hypothetical protein